MKGGNGHSLRYVVVVYSTEKSVVVPFLDLLVYWHLNRLIRVRGWCHSAGRRTVEDGETAAAKMNDHSTAKSNDQYTRIVNTLGRENNQKVACVCVSERVVARSFLSSSLLLPSRQNKLDDDMHLIHARPLARS